MYVFLNKMVGVKQFIESCRIYWIGKCDNWELGTCYIFCFEQKFIKFIYPLASPFTWVRRCFTSSIQKRKEEFFASQIRCFFFFFIFLLKHFEGVLSLCICLVLSEIWICNKCCKKILGRSEIIQQILLSIM